MAATALFISPSAALRDEVGVQAACWPGVVFRTSSQASEGLLTGTDNLAIVYLHVVGESTIDADQVLCFADRHRDRPAVVAVVDAFDTTIAVRLLQQGYVDCLPLPLDYGRMAMQIEYEIWRARHLPHQARERLCDSTEVAVASLEPVGIKTAPVVPLELESSRRSAELAAIHQALTTHNNNRSKAAAALGVSRVTLYKKLRKYGMMEYAQDPG